MVHVNSLMVNNDVMGLVKCQSVISLSVMTVGYLCAMIFADVSKEMLSLGYVLLVSVIIVNYFLVMPWVININKNNGTNIIF